MMPYYWTPTTQQQMTPPPVTLPSGRPPGREESYIENILRLNRGKPATFHFSFEHAVEQGKTQNCSWCGRSCWSRSCHYS